MRKGTLGIAVAVLMIISFGVGYLAGGGRTTTVTVTTTSDAYEQVESAYAAHLMQLNSRNIAALASEYEPNATLEWTGSQAVGPGNYTGASNIKILWGSFIGKFINFSLSNEYQSIGVEGNVSVVNSTFDFRGYDFVGGTVNGSVVAQAVYEHVGGSWLIGRETWNFTQFNGQIPTVIAG
jgi:ketosteroid isomerase-like protein